jgi:hypothetical protein
MGKKIKAVKFTNEIIGWDYSSTQNGDGWTITVKNKANFSRHFILTDCDLMVTHEEITSKEDLSLKLKYVSDPLIDPGESGTIRLELKRRDGSRGSPIVFFSLAI